MRSLIDGVKVASVCRGSSTSLLGAPRELGGHVTPRRDEILLPAPQPPRLGYSRMGRAGAEGPGCPAHCCSATELPRFRAVCARVCCVSAIPEHIQVKPPNSCPVPAVPVATKRAEPHGWMLLPHSIALVGAGGLSRTTCPPAQLCPNPLGEQKAETQPPLRGVGCPHSQMSLRELCVAVTRSPRVLECPASAI